MEEYLCFHSAWIILPPLQHRTFLREKCLIWQAVNLDVMELHVHKLEKKKTCFWKGNVMEEWDFILKSVFTHLLKTHNNFIFQPQSRICPIYSPLRYWPFQWCVVTLRSQNFPFAFSISTSLLYLFGNGNLIWCDFFGGIKDQKSISY